MKRFVTLAFIIGALAVSATRAEAVAITGQITLSQGAIACPGAMCVIPINGLGATGAATATALDFTATGAATPNVNGPFQIDGATGSFAAALGALPVTGSIRDFCFNPAGAGGCGVYPTAPLAAFETAVAGGFIFDMATVVLDFQDANGILLHGTGLFHLAGFDNTPGTFSLSITQPAGAVAFSFSATEAATPAPVPEPGSMILLGTGLAGLSATLRRRLARKK